MARMRFRVQVWLVAEGLKRNAMRALVSVMGRRSLLIRIHTSSLNELALAIIIPQTWSSSCLSLNDDLAVIHYHNPQCCGGVAAVVEAGRVRDKDCGARSGG